MATSPSSSKPRLIIANRGEIAIRVIRAAIDEGWTTIAVYSEADRHALHVSLADEAYLLGPAQSQESYLHVPRILEAAHRGRATHLHPGYGFLSENADFAQACRDHDLTFIGPPPEAMRSMGDKVSARATAAAFGLPLIPGTPGLGPDPAEATEQAERIGYPVLIKAAYGGGGKGMRLCRDRGELLSALALTRGEAGRAFGNDLLYLEKAILRPRHVEIQILCDGQGHGIYLGERECSIQRRHQKLIEESPSPAITPEARRRMGEGAVRLALGIGYVSAGTVEFILSPEGDFYFLEMNTRLQVEHPITEATTGIDLVRAQLKVALGEPLPWSQEEIHPAGASMECRICAEDPTKDFLPASGRILWARLPQGPGVRNDIGFEIGSPVPMHYDSMLGKLITWGRDREEARTRMLRALEEYTIEGIRTNITFHRFALRHPEFVAGHLHTGFVDEHWDPSALVTAEDETLAAWVATVAAFRERERPAASAASSVATSTSRATSSGQDPLAPRFSPWKRGRRSRP